MDCSTESNNVVDHWALAMQSHASSQALFNVNKTLFNHNSNNLSHDLVEAEQFVSYPNISELENCMAQESIESDNQGKPQEEQHPSDNQSCVVSDEELSQFISYMNNFAEVRIIC